MLKVIKTRGGGRVLAVSHSQFLLDPPEYLQHDLELAEPDFPVAVEVEELEEAAEVLVGDLLELDLPAEIVEDLLGVVQAEGPASVGVVLGEQTNRVGVDFAWGHRTTQRLGLGR